MIPLRNILVIALLYFSSQSYAQIDYKALIRNLEDVTKETNLKDFFEGLPNNMSKNEGEFKDERFLRLYGVVVDNVEFENSWSGRYLSISLFDEEVDYKIFKEKFTSLYGDPEIDDSYQDELYYEWSSEENRITMSVKLEEDTFLKFNDKLTIKFIEE